MWLHVKFESRDIRFRCIFHIQGQLYCEANFDHNMTKSCITVIVMEMIYEACMWVT